MYTHIYPHENNMTEPYRIDLKSHALYVCKMLMTLKNDHAIKTYLDQECFGMDKKEILEWCLLFEHTPSIRVLFQYYNALPHVRGDIFTVRSLLDSDDRSFMEYLDKKCESGEEDTYLEYVSLFGHASAVQYLIRWGADLHYHHDRALRWASCQGHLEVVRYLLEQGADVHAGHDEPLRMASMFSHEDVVQCLTQYGAVF